MLYTDIRIYKGELEYPTTSFATLLFMLALIHFTLVVYIFLCIIKYNYIIIEEKALTMKSVLYPFRNASFTYQEIEYIEFSNSLQPYFKIFPINGKSKFYILGCVRSRDYAEIIELLEQKGIKFEIGEHVKRTYLRKNQIKYN